MAKKKINRKKQLKKQLADLKRAGRVGVATAREAVETVAHKTEAVVEKVVEQVKEVTSSATSLEAFLALPELEGIAAARLETFYQAGIQSVADFANHTEKELLALKGIGSATIKQLKEKGIDLKA
ncbi:helix-hairpin-helix domain-containing protein [Streptococcus suis]|uniref:Helix-hairpin-helix domain-containing protein n=1 Tax=Streptococcus suis TaxID=1307 RepID=A0AAP6DWI2_STRSU|nr:helix-hairpin-helix domain-containing protein [Streptococcus suis]MBS8067572.1 helix-hairpin-helix domain-containing protein [Streptococcus suis]MBS8082550.1 helix-hairpin-helix domain-containing protein [Streptococcus suis]MBS8084790.1 helix-hairpin-helix domain-containing protein [Streptococcus suis]MBS8112566.1 helix-hairpin-helix domain-containing protein [Streptococcus suis]MCB2863680.1 helix-hairpin-helix domain-containing protein [Streptococcus suis]